MLLAEIFGASGDALSIGLVVTLVGAAFTVAKLWGRHQSQSEGLRKDVDANKASLKELDDSFHAIDKRVHAIEPNSAASGIFRK